jgi:hypothetical protein
VGGGDREGEIVKKISALFVLALVAACGGAAEPTDDTAQPVKSCVQTAMCIQGDVWSQKSCSCVPEKGPKCGKKSCGANEYCCNASCGLCAPLGSACIQIACVPQ